MHYWSIPHLHTCGYVCVCGGGGHCDFLTFAPFAPDQQRVMYVLLLLLHFLHHFWERERERGEKRCFHRRAKEFRRLAFLSSKVEIFPPLTKAHSSLFLPLLLLYTFFWGQPLLSHIDKSVPVERQFSLFLHSFLFCDPRNLCGKVKVVILAPLLPKDTFSGWPAKEKEERF